MCGGGGGVDDRQVTVISTENKSVTTQTNKTIKAKTHCKEERGKKSCSTILFCAWKAR